MHPKEVRRSISLGPLRWSEVCVPIDEKVQCAMSVHAKKWRPPPRSPTVLSKNSQI